MNKCLLDRHVRESPLPTAVPFLASSTDPTALGPKVCPMLAKAGTPHLRSLQRVPDPSLDASGGKVKLPPPRE